MRLRNVLAMARKEGRTMRRDHGLLAAILVQPVLYLILFGLAITNEVNNAAWVVYDQSRTTLSRQLIADLTSLTALREPHFVLSEDEVVDFLRQQDGLAGVVIPWDFADKLRRGQEAPIQILLNGAQTASALRLGNYITQTASVFSLSEPPSRDRSEQKFSMPRVSIEKRYWYNPGLQDRFGLLSAMPANMLTQICLMIAAVGLVGERERGTFEQLLSTPLSLAEIMLGKMIPYIGIGFVSLAMLQAGGYVFYGIAVKGSLLLLAVTALAFMFATMAFGVFFAARARHTQQAIFLSFFFMFPSIMITGILVPTDNYPLFISALSQCLPARYFAHALHAIVLKGSGFAEVQNDLLFLTGFFIVSLAAAVRVTKAKLG
ncbi:MAG TPA: ABC transporter permease [Methylomirabilota bacterium]|jgi:ABC-2 type transport system permease protein|nr:ABC transporter permease [Methylomirabilota bacterium]